MLYEKASDKVCSVPAYSGAKIVNTVGAGDALFSSFLHFYAKGMTAKNALQRAVVFAGLKIKHNGASIGFCAEEEIERIVDGGKK